MGGKNRKKALEKFGGGASSSSKKKKPAGGVSGAGSGSSKNVKVANKSANKAARQKGVKDLESRGGSLDAKRAAKASNKSARASDRAAERAGGGPADAEARKKKQRNAKGGTGGASVKQMKQHAHEPRAMSKHDAAYNDRAQRKADKLAGKDGGGAASAGAGKSSGGGAESDGDSEPEANAADHRYFSAREDMTGFFDSLNADDLSWSKSKTDAKGKTGKKQANQPRVIMPQPGKRKHDSDEEEDDDDEDDDEEDDSEEEGPARKKARGEKGVASFERLPRTAAWASAAAKPEAKERMPVRLPDGSWAASEVTKADVLRARAERLEQMQKRQAASAASAAPSQDGADDDDEDGEAAMVDADAPASEGEEEQQADGEDDDDDEGSEASFDDRLPSEDEEEEEDEEDLDAELEVEDASAVVTETPAKLRAAQQARLHEVKLLLAESSELVLENPDKHIGRLEPMLQLLTSDSDPLVQQLALLSCTEVLVDLMPSFRIRMPTEEELNGPGLSKEVKATWKYERSFLLYYGRLVSTLLAMLKSAFPKSFNDRMDVSAFQFNLLRAGCKLLERAHHFNYRKEVLHSMTPFLNHASPRVRTLLLQSLVSIFRGEVSGESTLEIVKILGRVIKEKGRRAHDECLLALLYLPLHKEILQAAVDDPKKKAPQVKKKGNSYVSLEDKNLDKDLAEGEATVSVATRKKIQTALLTEVMTAYFRILKQQSNSRLLPLVLKGLAKYAPLIDVDMVLDLLDCLKLTIASSADPSDADEENQLPLESTLYVILTSFQTLASHGHALALDLKDFYNALYACLPRFAEHEHGHVQLIPLLLQCVHVMFHETKQLSLERVAAFVQRMCALALYVPPNGTLALLHAVRLCLNRYPKVKQLLDREATASGVHLAEIDDPDLCNSMAATLWELGLLKSGGQGAASEGGHYHPFVSVYASSVLEDAALPLALARTTPTQLFENYDASEGGFNPPLVLPMAFQSTSTGGSAGASVSMKKKLDLRRRMQAASLSLAARDPRLQSPFMREMTRVSAIGGGSGAAGLAGAKRRRSELSPSQKQTHLQQLKELAARVKLFRQKKAASSAGTASGKKKNKQQQG